MPAAQTIISVIGCAGGVSVRGASHIGRQAPNQDAVAWEQQRLWTYLAVADGHGSAPHYRSDRGSRFAVAAAMSVMRGVTEQGTLREADALAERISTLAPKLVEDWQARVQADLDQDPVQEAPGTPSYAVYGSTCVAVGIGPGMTLLMQVGDGDVFVGTERGGIETPLPPDETEGEQTYSLCLPDAADHVKLKLFSAPNPLAAPDFILAATDGFAKSFDSTAAVTEIVSQCRTTTRERGLAKVIGELEPWLMKCSQMGSGDDTSVAIFTVDKSTDALPAGRPVGSTTAPLRAFPTVAVLIALIVGGVVGASAAMAWAEWDFLSLIPGARHEAPPQLPLRSTPADPRVPEPSKGPPRPAPRSP